MSQVIKKALVKTALWGIVLCFLLILSALIALHSPYVQTKLTQKLAFWVSEHTSFSLSVDQVGIDWFDELSLKNLTVKDSQDSVMIDAPKLVVDFSLLDLLDNGEIFVEGASLHAAQVHVIKNTPEQDFNINLFIRELQSISGTQTDSLSSGNPPVFNLEWAKIHNTVFTFNDPEKDSLPGQFDYYHFKLEQIEGSIKDFVIDHGAISLNVEHMQAYEPVNDLKIDTLQTKFTTSDTLMHFDDLYFAAGNSILKDELTFEYSDYEDFSDFNRKVNISAQLVNSTLHSKDLTLFAPDMAQYNDLFKVSGYFQGSVDNFSLKEMRLSFGRRSTLRGAISFYGLPEFMEAFIDININKGRVYTTDLKQYIPGEVSDRLEKFGMAYFNGTLQGFFTDFVANGSFSTQLGDFTTDINLKFPANGLPSYSGQLITKNFKLGKLIEKDSLIQQIDLNGTIKGRGFNLEDADLTLNANISRLGVKNYEYQKIKTNAHLAKELFEGQITITDPNLKFDANGVVDLRKGYNKIKVNMNLDTAVFHEMKLSPQPLTLKSKVELDIKGLHLDSIIGEGSVHQTEIYYQDRKLEVDDLEVYSKKDSISRTISINTDAFNAEATGDFYFSNLIADLQKTYKEYSLNFFNRSKEIESYYNQKKDLPNTEYEIQYKASLKDINPWLELLVPELYISPNTNMDGRFRNGYTTILTFNTVIDSLKYADYQIKNTQVDISTSKLSDSTNVLAMAYIASDQQLSEGKPLTENFIFEGIWDQAKIDFQSKAEQFGHGNEATVSGQLQFMKDTTILHFGPSVFDILNKEWTVDPRNKLLFYDQKVQIERLKVEHKEKTIDFNGMVSRNPQDSLMIRLEKLQANVLNPLLDVQLSGVIDGSVTLKNLFGDPMITNQLEARNFYINDFLVGDLYSNNQWVQQEKLLNVDFWIDRKNKKIVQVQGVYHPLDKESPLDLKARFNSAHLDVAEPFVDELFTELKGVANGELTITGHPTHPVLQGKGEISGGQMRFNYLNTLYTFDGEILFDVNEIGVRNVKLKDINQNEATLSGGIFHDGFQEFILDLSAKMDNFQVLNTSSKDNKLYYGIAYATGELNVLGAVNNLYISANATTNKNTKFFIPLSSYSDVQVEKEDYIHFVNLNDTSMLQDRDELNPVDLSGVKLDFDLDITQDAYCELIFDIKSGDIIRGRGNGKLKLQIDTQGEFNMFGDYEFTEGGYNFTLQNIINKEFNIERGSRINWLGDPYAGQLAMKASYTQMASINPVLKYLESGTNSPNNQAADAQQQISRKYPVKVLMDIEGDLLSPDINFDIAFDEVPKNLTVGAAGVPLEDAIRNFKNQLETDEQELKRQVFSLIILRKLSDPNSFSPGGNSVGNSLSEFLSNQLSYWASQFDDNLEIDVNINELSPEMLNSFQLRLSYTLLDGRLRVTRDGGFTDVDNETNFNSIVGEWTVEYLMTADGRLRAKMYNRNNLNQASNELGYSSSAGVSVLHVQSFDQLKELFSFLQKKVKEENKQEKTTPPNDAILKDDEEPEVNQTEN